MKTWIAAVVTTTLTVAAVAVVAQPGRGPGAGPGPMAAASGASGPGMGMRHGMGPGMGPGKGMGPGARWGADHTPGWSMMTPQERDQHRDRMRGMTDPAACAAYMAEHREQMAARAKERGVKPPAQPRHDACAMGRS